MAQLLNSWVAGKKRAIFDELRVGQCPSEGRFEEEVWSEVKDLGSPQMGSTVYKPDKILVEFIYQSLQSAAVLLVVELDVPERVVFMPVPDWVVATIWQGEVHGSYRFESEARELLAKFEQGLETEANSEIFGKVFSDGGRS